MSTVSRIPNQNVVAVQSGAGFHNSIYRGKYLGSSVSSAQWAAISAGTFEDLFIGDYWTMGGVNWRIAAFDYWLHAGNTDITAHHAVIVPDTALATAAMNSTDTTAGGYVGSDFYTGNNGNTAKATAISAVNAAFGAAHILSHNIQLSNAVTDGKVTGAGWYTSTVDLMSEIMITGNNAFTSNPGLENGVDYRILPLFALNRSLLYTSRNVIWTRTVGNATGFAIMTGGGRMGLTTASYSRDIRPAFAIVA